MDQCCAILARNLHRLRKRRNFSQKYLSELSCISRATIGKIESGKSESVTVHTLIELAEALDVSVGDFFAPFCLTKFNEFNEAYGDSEKTPKGNKRIDKEGA